jgi:hypothetical protein
MGAVGIAAFGGAVGGAVGLAAAPLGAAIGLGEGVGSAAVASGLSGVGAGAASRGASTILVGGGDVFDATVSAFNPADMGKDLVIGAGTGVAVYGAGVGLEAGYNAIKRAVSTGASDGAGGGAASSASSSAHPGGGGPAGEPLVPDEPVNSAPPAEQEAPAVAKEEPTTPAAQAPTETPKPEAPAKAQKAPRAPRTKSDTPRIGMPDHWRYIDNSVTGMPAEFDFTQSQLAHEFKHAADFGVTGKWNIENAHKFAEAIFQHIQDPNVQPIQGTLNWKVDCVIYYNSVTHTFAAFDLATREFLAGWQISEGAQLTNFLRTNNIGRAW